MYYFRTKASGYHISGDQDIIDLLSAVFTQKSPSIFPQKNLLCSTHEVVILDRRWRWRFTILAE